MSIRFTNTTDTNTPITLSLLKRMTDYNLTDAEFVAGREYEVVNSWTPNGSASFPYYLPYDNSADLEAGNAYFMGVQTIDEGTYELSVQAIVEADRDFSTGTWAETVDGDFIWFFGLGSLTDFTPAIRLILSEIPENVEEQKRLVGLDQFQINPNPASSNANIMFSLNTPRFVAYEVRDLNGKLMGWKNMGQFVGQSQFQIDVTSYPVGNYMVNLVIDGKDLFTQQMSVIK